MSLLKSFGYSIKGFLTAMREERNIRIHFGATLIVTALGFWFEISSSDWCILLIMIGTVISAELFNTSIEILADVVTKEQHPSIGKVKDIASAAVLILCVVSVIVGVIVFAKYV
jgi:diacylglycerol kinase (ATP)